MTQAPAKFDPDGVAPAWADAVQAVPRAGFLPRRMWPFDTATAAHSFVDRDRDPEAWQTAAEADIPVTTQWDDGQHEGEEAGRLPSSSSSTPRLVLRMLDELDVRPGMRVLEVGTGTGWNAGLLAHHLGDEAVVSVEVDPEVAELARASLKRAALGPRVVTGDGAEGWPDGAPYDRVIATCGMRRIPGAWVEQTRPGGVILAPWGTHYSNRDALVRLTVDGDGVASGRFLRMVQFMKLRAQRLMVAPAEYLTGEWPHGADITPTALGPEVVTASAYDSAPYILGLAVPDCTHMAGEQHGETVAWFYSLSDRSWAAARFTPGEDGGEVYQHGPRRLWGEVEAAWRWWDRAGRPGVERFGLTITPKGEQAWLDDPGRPVVA